MERKELDLLLNIIGNPTSTLLDLMNNGLSVKNTSLENEDTYKNSLMIQSNPIFLNQQGEFDDNKLKQQYLVATSAYNYMANLQHNENIVNQFKYSSQNIFVDPSKRDMSPGFVYTKMPNPLRITVGLSGINKFGTPKLSESEIAQTQEVVDYNTGKKMASPNGNWFKYLGETLVLALYDKTEDINGKKEGEAGFDATKVAHKAGELKLNENGTYYYETLGGRDVTGRRVLWKGDTLTTDGSWANRHLDFFDSDDIELNSGVKTILKNTALVGSMFLPVVGPYVALTSAAIQTAGLFGTVGRLLSFDNSSMFNNLEGWALSMNRQTGRTDAARLNMWTMEGFLNLAGDVLGQLAEQRAVFKYVPKIFMGRGVDKESLAELENKYVLEIYNASKDRLPSIEKAVQSELEMAKYAKVNLELMLSALTEAANKVSLFTKDYYDLGAKISKAYMTGITTASSYGEAIKEGANPMEAALFALGYAGAEYRLLSTGVGEWILPELRMLSAEHKKIIQMAFKDTLESAKEGTRILTNSALSKIEKSKVINKLLHLGKQVAHTDYSLAKGIVGNLAANALGEGVEEVSEELLLDVSKQIFNTLHWLGGSDTRLTAWDNMRDRYLMSFFGGALGGGLAGVSLGNLLFANEINNMTSEVAMLKLVAISRDEEQRAAFLKNLDKLEIGNEYLSKSYETDSDGNFIGWKLGDPNENLALDIKQAVRQTLDFIDNVLTAEGAKLNDDSILQNVIKDVRFAALMQSHTGEKVISRFNTLMTDIYKTSLALKGVDSPQNKALNGDGDLKGEESRQTKELRSELQRKLDELIKEKDDLLAGKYSGLFALEALIEMNPYVYKKLLGMSFIRYAETKSGMDFNKIPENLMNEYVALYQQYSSTLGKDEVSLMSQFYVLESNNMISSLLKLYDTLDENTKAYEHITSLAEGLLGRLDTYKDILYRDSEGFLTTLQEEEDAKSEANVVHHFMPLFLDLARTEEELQLAELDLQRINAESDLEKEKEIIKEINAEWLRRDIPKLLDAVTSVINIGFANTLVVDFLTRTLFDLQFNHVNLLYSGAEADRMRSSLESARNSLKKIKHTPILEFLDKYVLASNGMSLTDLLKTLDTRLHSIEAVSDFGVDNNLLNLINEALAISDLVEGLLYGARTDKLGIDIVQDTNTREYDLNSNYFGINAVVKHLALEYDGDDFYKSLPTIEGGLADLAILDISLIKKLLVFYKDLIAINVGQKLTKLDRILANFSYILYKAMLNFVVSIPDDWEGKDKLQAVMDNMSFTKEHYEGENRKLTLNESEHITLEKEKLDLMMAVHEFFNLKAIKEKSIDELALLFNPKNFDLIHKSTERLTENTSHLDGFSFISWLAATSAINPESFYSAYSKISIEGIAAVPGQEFGILCGVAHYLNGDLISKIIKATLKGMFDYFSDPEHKERLKEIDKDEKMIPYLLNEGLFPKFFNTLLIEGIPGSGKTSAVITTILKTLKSIEGDNLKNAWFVHTSAKNAKILNGIDENNKEEIIKDSNYFGHIDLLSKISTYERPKTNKGIINYTDDDIVVTESGRILSKAELKNIENLPSIIIIDEVSKYTEQEFEIIDRFAKANGISVIVAGDFDLSPMKSDYFISDINNSLTGYLDSTEFFGPMKLGDSFRIANILEAKNFDILSEVTQQGEGEIKFHYYKSNNVFNGKLTFVNEFNDYESEEENITNILAQIDAIIPTLKDGEKIGFVYYSKNTKLAEELTSDKYKNYIEEYYDNPALGDEADYFVIDFTGKDLDDKGYKDFYTAVTRSRKGSLIVFEGDNSFLLKDKKIVVDSLEDNLTYESSLSKLAIENYSQKRKSRLEKVLEGKDVTPLTSSKKVKEETNLSKVKNNKEKVEVLEALDLDGKPLPVPLVVPEQLALDEAVVSTIEGNVSDTLGLIHIDEDGTVHIDIGLYTHASLELGITDWEVDTRPKFVEEVFELRIDSVYGLYKLLGAGHKIPLQDGNKLSNFKSSYLRKLAELSTILLSKKSKAEIEQLVALSLGFNVTVTYAIKNSANPSEGDINIYKDKAKDYNKFSKGTNEQLEGVYNEDKSSKIAKRRQLVAIIGKTDVINGKSTSTDVLEIPLGTLSSPITYFNTQNETGYVLKDIHATFEQALLQSDGRLYEAVSTVYNKYKNDPKYKELMYLTKLWLDTGNVVIYAPDLEWTPGKDLIDQGPLVDLAKGFLLEDVTLLIYDPRNEKPIPVSLFATNPKFKVSRILIPKSNIIDGGVVIKAGNPIILWSDTVPESDLVLTFLKEILDKDINKYSVKFSYVVAPSYSIKEYLESLLNLTNKTGEEVVGYGNIFTPYYVLRTLMYDDAGNIQLEFVDFVKNKFPRNGEDIINTLLALFAEIDSIQPDNSIIDEQQRIVDVNKKIKNLLFSPSDLFKDKEWVRDSNIAVANQLLSILIQGTLSVSRTNGVSLVISLNVDLLERLSRNKVVRALLNFGTEIEGSPFIEAIVDSGNAYKLFGKDFVMKSKLTSRAFISPTENNSLLSWILDSYDKNILYTKENERKSKHNKFYIENRSNDVYKKVPEEGESKTLLLVKDYSQYLNEDEINTLNTITDLNVLKVKLAQTINSKHLGIWLLPGKSGILKIILKDLNISGGVSVLELKNTDIENIESIEAENSGNIEFSVITPDGILYKVIYDVIFNTLIANKVVLESVEEVEEIPLGFTDSDIDIIINGIDGQLYKNMLSKFKGNLRPLTLTPILLNIFRLMLLKATDTNVFNALNKVIKFYEDGSSDSNSSTDNNNNCPF